METILSHRDACKALSISKPTLYRLTNQGKLQKIRVSDGRVGWLQSSIERYIATCVKDTLKTYQKSVSNMVQGGPKFKPNVPQICP